MSFHAHFSRLLLFVATAASLGGQPVPTFQHNVLPLLQRRCTSCHGNTNTPMGGLDLRTLEAAMAGGASGAVVIPGDPDKSLLWKMVDSGKMPAGGDALPQEDKTLIREWIRNGQFPSRDKVLQTTQAERIEKGRLFWSFQRPVKHPVPVVKETGSVRNPVDAFVLAHLEGRNLTFNPEADRRTLIRRLSFDLLGLPPSPEEVQAFVNDRSPDAYERLVDRLLASPHYGERWARHWLDIAGYSDSNGYLEDWPRRHVWKYRDWVIRALNDDKPYNEFLVEQIAGDQVAGFKPGVALSDEAAKQKLIATGFLRLTPDGSDNQKLYQVDKQYDALHAVTEVSMKAVMGLNLNCARCHDHKFDPILQKDYYATMAIFQAAYDPQNWLPANPEWGNWPIRIAYNAPQEDVDQWLKLFNGRERALRQTVRRKFRSQTNEAYATYRTRWQEKQAETLDEPLRSQVLATLRTPADKRDQAAKDLLQSVQKLLEISDDALESEHPEIKEKLAAIDKEIEAEEERLEELAPEAIWGLWDTSPTPDSRILVRGNYLAPGDPVEPGVPAVLDDPKNPFKVSTAAAETVPTGGRLALAKWLTQPDHPLTARVIVNRVWQFHFGVGIVKTPDDFGSQGARPTHPELLDWLAVNFVEHGWSLKWLHRVIVESAVYRQSASDDTVKREADPSNLLYWRRDPRRLDAESIRDAILAVAGQLDSTMYGRPVALKKGADGQSVVDLEKGPENRRSIYLQTKRTTSLDFLTAFDFPRMETNVPERFRSNVARQGLALMNNPFVVRSAEALAERVRREADGNEKKAIEWLFQLVYSRPADNREMDFAMTVIHDAGDETAWRTLCQVVLASNEFLYVE